MPMKISVDSSRCQGHALCAAVDEDLFPLDDQGYSSLGEPREVPAGSEENARLGVAACPERALTLHD
jgi:ferredoxin